MRSRFLSLALFATLCALLARSPSRAASEPPPLKDLFKSDFLVGVALNANQFTDRDPRGAALALRNFNAISPENALKWESLHPRPDANGYDFRDADRYVEFGVKHGLFLVGHTLVWHGQTPTWVFQDDHGRPASREVLLQRMRDHIHTVVGRYRGRIKAWDVVNEALEGDGTLRDSPWRRIIGDDYIAKAFQYAHEADPAAELRYNDFALENPPKRQAAIALVKSLQAQRIPIGGLGLQTHANLNWPGEDLLDSALTDFATLGIPLSITELDVNAAQPAQPGQHTQSADIARAAQAAAGGLAPEASQRLAARYAAIFRALLRHRTAIKLVTFWGLTDKDSWLAAGQPLLFDAEGRPKQPAYDAVLAEAKKSRVPAPTSAR